MDLYKFLTGILRPIFYVLYRIEIKGNVNLPKDGSYVMASNHIHNFDPVLLACILKKRKIHYLGKKELFKYKFFANMFDKVGVIPLDRNKNDINAIKKALKALKSGAILGIFPQGTRANSDEENSAKAGMGMFALKTNSPVIPVRIEGNYRLFSKIKITILDIYNIPEHYQINPNSENYLKVANEVMNIIKS